MEQPESKEKRGEKKKGGWVGRENKLCGAEAAPAGARSLVSAYHMCEAQVQVTQISL